MNTPRTPREILLARHSSARAALDAQRAALLARFASPDTAFPEASASAPPHAGPSAAFSPLAILRELIGLLHRELFAPYRRAWSALACVWIALFAFQQLERLAAQPFASARIAASDSAADAALLALWLEQRRQLAALAAGYGMGDPLVSPAPARETISPPAASHPLGAIESAPARLSIA